MQKVISKDGAEIAFDKTGQGPAVILVDGALCYRSFGPMPKLAPLLAPHFTVYVYDRRGRGDSGATLSHDAAIMGDFSLPTRLVASVNVPTLVMGGGKSPANLRHAVQAVADALPGARRRTLEGQTHNVSMKVLAPVLKEFFTG